MKEPESFVWTREGELPQPARSCSQSRFIFDRAMSIAGLPIIGNGNCVELIQHYMLEVGRTSTWEFEDESVVDIFKNGGRDTSIRADGIREVVIGTVIGNKTEDGRWPGLDHGNHVCFYHLLGAWTMPERKLETYTVIDQFILNGLKTIQIRRLTSKGKGPDGKFIDPSNNADAFFPLKRIIRASK